MKPIVIWMKEKDTAELTKQEIEEIIQQAYNQGYNAGYAAGTASHITTNPPCPNSPWIQPSWTGQGPVYNPCTTAILGGSEDGHTHITLKG